MKNYKIHTYHANHQMTKQQSKTDEAKKYYSRLLLMLQTCSEFIAQITLIKFRYAFWFYMQQFHLKRAKYFFNNFSAHSFKLLFWLGRIYTRMHNQYCLRTNNDFCDHLAKKIYVDFFAKTIRSK